MPAMNSGPSAHSPTDSAAEAQPVSVSGEPDMSTLNNLELVHLLPAYVIHEPKVSVLKPLIDDGTFYQFKDMVTEVIHNLDHILDDAQDEVSGSRSSSVSYVPSCSNISLQLSATSSTVVYREDYDDDYSDFEDDDEQDVFGDDEQHLEEDSDDSTSTVDSRNTMIDNLKARFEANLHQQSFVGMKSSQNSSSLSLWSTSNSNISNQNIIKQKRLPLILNMKQNDHGLQRLKPKVVNMEEEAQKSLEIWLTRSSNGTKENVEIKGCSHKFTNPSLPNMIENLCLRPELSDRLVLYPESQLPFRRTLSELNLTSIGIEDQNRNNKNLGKYDFLVNTITPTTTPEPNSDPVLISRQRSRSSLTMFHKSRLFGSRSGGDSLTPPTQRDRFNLNLAANLQTDAAQLASKSALAGKSWTLALKISKLQKKYYLAIPAEEIMGLIFRLHPERSPGLRLMLRFGQEVTQLVADRVRTEFTVDSQARMIAYFIEVVLSFLY